MAKLLIDGIQNVAPADEVLLTASITAARRHLSSDESSVVIFCGPRETNGWLEYGMRVKYGSGGGMYIGCIQRTPDSACEFHS